MVNGFPSFICFWRVPGGPYDFFQTLFCYEWLACEQEHDFYHKLRALRQHKIKGCRFDMNPSSLPVVFRDAAFFQLVKTLTEAVAVPAEAA